MARSGLSELITQFRSYTQESGTAIFSDDRIQQILDNNSFYFTQEPLRYQAYYLNGTVTYKDAYLSYGYLEGTATNTVRVYNSGGTTVTNYTSDFINGKFTFDSNTLGTAYYMTGRGFNFFKAVADGWNEKAAYYAGNFDFKVEGREFKKSQIVKQCKEMAQHFLAQSSTIQHDIDRGDMTGSAYQVKHIDKLRMEY